MTDHPTEPELEAPEMPGVPGKKRRRRRHRGSVEVLPSGSVRARIKHVCTPDGRPVPVFHTVTGGPSLDWRINEARRVHLPRLEARALDIEAGRYVPEATTTLAAWVEQAQKSRRLRPFDARDRSSWKHLRPLWGLPLMHIDRGRVEQWVGWLRAREVTRGGVRRPMAAGTVRTCYALLRRLLGVAESEGSLARLPFTTLRRGVLPPESESRRGAEAVLSPSELRTMLDAARMLDAEGLTDGSLALRLEFQGQFGLRGIECAWAEIRDLREEEGGRWLYVRRAKGSGAPSGEVDRLPVPVELWRRLWAHLEALHPRARVLGLIFPAEGLRKTFGPRWTQTRGEGRRARAWVRATELARLRERSGLEHVTAIFLRHTRITGLFSGGASEAEVQKMTRHKSRRIIQGYAKNQAALPEAAFASPFATPVGTPAPARLVALPGGASAPAPSPSRATRGTAPAPAFQAPRVVPRATSATGVGPEPHGTDVGREPAPAPAAPSPSALGYSLADLEAASALVEESRSWPTVDAFAVAIVARAGREVAGEQAGNLVELARARAVGEDSPRLGHIGAAIQSVLRDGRSVIGPTAVREEEGKKGSDSGGNVNGIAG